MQRITNQYRLTFGMHKGAHIASAPKQWIKWACDNVKGFQDELDCALAKMKPATKRDIKPIEYNQLGRRGGNKPFTKPRANRFTSKAKRIPGATLDM